MLSAGLLVNKILQGSAAVTGFVGDRIYPIVTVEETTFPFIVYERTSVSPTHTKDGRCYDYVICTVFVFAENYSESVLIAEAVRSAMEETVVEKDGLTADDIRMSSAAESFSNDTFIQELTFTMETH